MTLFNKLEDTIRMGYEVSFRTEILQLFISVKIESRNKVYKKESALPLADHFYEEKIVYCIAYMIAEIELEIRAVSIEKYLVPSLADKYIGIKKPDSNGTNIGLIWERKEDGKYYCATHPNRTLEAWQIKHDLSQNYIRPYTDANT